MSDIVERLREKTVTPFIHGLASELQIKDPTDLELEAATEILRLRAENEKLRAALKPFADISGLIPEKYTDDSEWWTDIYEVSLAMPTVGDLRAAAKALKGDGDE